MERYKLQGISVSKTGIQALNTMKNPFPPDMRHKDLSLCTKIKNHNSSY